MKTDQEARRVLAALEPAILGGEVEDCGSNLPVGAVLEGTRLRIETQTGPYFLDQVPAARSED